MANAGDPGDEELLEQPRRVSLRGLIVIAVIALGVVALVAVRIADSGGSRRSAAATPSEVATTSATPRATSGPAPAPAPAASDVLVPGLQTAELTGQGFVVQEADIVNTSSKTVIVQYPIAVLGRHGRPVMGVDAGLFAHGDALQPTGSGVAADRNPLRAIAPGRTVSLVVSVPVDCRDHGALYRALDEGVQASVRIPPALGSATFTLSDDSAPVRHLESACRTASP